MLRTANTQNQWICGHWASCTSMFSPDSIPTDASPTLSSSWKHWRSTNTNLYKGSATTQIRCFQDCLISIHKKESPRLSLRAIVYLKTILTRLLKNRKKGNRKSTNKVDNKGCHNRTFTSLSSNRTINNFNSQEEEVGRIGKKVTAKARSRGNNNKITSYQIPINSLGKTYNKCNLWARRPIVPHQIIIHNKIKWCKGKPRFNIATHLKINHSSNRWDQGQFLIRLFKCLFSKECLVVVSNSNKALIRCLDSHPNKANNRCINNNKYPVDILRHILWTGNNNRIREDSSISNHISKRGRRRRDSNNNFMGNRNSHSKGNIISRIKGIINVEWDLCYEGGLKFVKFYYFKKMINYKKWKR